MYRGNTFDTLFTGTKTGREEAGPLAGAESEEHEEAAGPQG